MKTFVDPDTMWLHGIKNGTEYCLGRPNGNKLLCFSEEIGFALEQFLHAIGQGSLVATMWKFANACAVPLNDPKVCALVHMLKRICDLRTSEHKFETTARASDTHEIVMLRWKLDQLRGKEGTR